MGTPGDKKNIGKVVKRELQQQIDQDQQSFSLPVANIPFQQQQSGVIELKIFVLQIRK